MKDYYKILEVDRNASQEVIEKAYKTLVKKYHPDLQPKDKLFFAESKMKNIIEAYEVLSNPESRENYDNYYNNKKTNYKQQNDSEIYKNLYTQNQHLEDEVKKLKKEKKEQQKIINRIPVVKELDFKSYINIIGNALYNETKKDKIEKRKDLIALLLTIIIVSIIVFILKKINWL